MAMATHLVTLWINLHPCSERCLWANRGGGDGDDVLLIQRYYQEQFGDERVGEILNNSSRNLGMFDVATSASIYDAAGQLVDSENGFLETGKEIERLQKE
jgi:hypothetical protein